MAHGSYLGDKEENNENCLQSLLLKSLVHNGRIMIEKVEKEKEINLVIMEIFRGQQHIKLAIFYRQLKMKL